MRKFIKYPSTKVTGATDTDNFIIKGTVLKQYTGRDKHVVVPDGITEIDSFAFMRSSNITSIELPEGLITIGNFAFFDCSNLVSVNIPDSVVSIGQHAFHRTPLEGKIGLPDTNIDNDEEYDDYEEDEISFDEWYKSDEWWDIYESFVEGVKSIVRSARPDIIDISNDPGVQGMMGNDYWDIKLNEGDEFDVSIDFNWEQEQIDIFTDGPESAAKQYADKILEKLSA